MEGLIAQLVSGAVGGNVAGMLMKARSLGTLWNSVVGVLGGGVGGQVLNMVTGGGGGLVADAGGSAIGGAILMYIVSLFKKKAD
ncbi:MAG: hypothetical protein ACR2QM_12050 [Longimicrobiales bacterium]